MTGDKGRINRAAFVDMARELITLRLADEMDMLDDQIMRIVERYPITAGAAVIAHLVEATAATWDSLEDFSAHLLAADLARINEEES
jgi:hypothetical protein